MEKMYPNKVSLKFTDRELEILTQIQENEGQSSLPDVIHDCVKWYYQKLYHNKNKYVPAPPKITLSDRKKAEEERLNSLPELEVCKLWYGENAYYKETQAQGPRCYSDQPLEPGGPGLGNSLPFYDTVQKIVKKIFP